MFGNRQVFWLWFLIFSFLFKISSHIYSWKFMIFNFFLFLILIFSILSISQNHSTDEWKIWGISQLFRGPNNFVWMERVQRRTGCQRKHNRFFFHSCLSFQVLEIGFTSPHSFSHLFLSFQWIVLPGEQSIFRKLPDDIEVFLFLFFHNFAFSLF